MSEISEEEKEEIEKVYRLIHSMKIYSSDITAPIITILEKEYLIVTEHILKFIQLITKGNLNFETFIIFC